MFHEKNMKRKKFNFKSSVLFKFSDTQKLQKTEDPTLTLVTITTTRSFFKN